MDSIHSLRSSLPGRRRHDDSNLLTDFKAAAQSVTNLYKSAAAVQNKARSAGYQDALDDLLAFLDRENLGLMDGEGWKVRRWAHERLDDDGLGKQAGSEDEEEGGKDEEVASQQAESRSLSPEARRTAPVQRVASEVSEPQAEADVAPETPSSEQAMPPPATDSVPTAQEFTFRAASAPAYPSNHDRVSESGMEVDNNTPSQTNNEPTVRVTARPPRNSRHTRQRNGDGRTTTLNLSLGSGAGSKRKMPYPDLFDISGMNNDGHDRREGQGGGRGGGKRGRFV